MALNKLRKLFPSEYNFYPCTWILPTDINDFKQYLRATRNPYIIKPAAGKGIYLIRKLDDIDVA